MVDRIVWRTLVAIGVIYLLSMSLSGFFAWLRDGGVDWAEFGSIAGTVAGVLVLALSVGLVLARWILE